MATTIPGKATGIPGMATTIPARHPKVVAFRLESVVAFDRNRWSPSTGMGGRLRPEYAHWAAAEDHDPSPIRAERGVRRGASAHRGPARGFPGGPEATPRRPHPHPRRPPP